MKTALITGIAGQDGAYLAKLLLSKGYNVYGLNKQRTPLDNLKKLGLDKGVTIIEGDITDPSCVDMALRVSRPDEIYNLAAQSHVGYSFKCPQSTCAVNYTGYLNVLLGARRIVPHARIYQAGTSEMYGYAAGTLANENTPFQPMSPYAISKVAAHWAGVNARHGADQFVSNGILFNHESPLRHPDFVTRKITQAVARIAKGENHVLRLGNLDSVRDWGFAGDYVEAMWLMLQHDKPDDFIIATGQKRSVRDFASEAFKHSGLGVIFEGVGEKEKGYIESAPEKDDDCLWCHPGERLIDGLPCKYHRNPFIEIDPKFYRPNDLTYLCGDASKAREVLGWRPKVKFGELVEMMVRSDMQ